MAYFLSPALAQLRAEINALWPHRDKTSDGWIGDTSHAARPSDHNPDRTAGGIVRALDIDEDLVVGLTAAGEAMPLVAAIIADVRTRYVIYEGRIWTRDTGRWAPYTGTNAHRHHVHVSVRSVAGHDRDASPWGIAATVSRPVPGAGGSITTPTIPGRPAPLTPTESELDMPYIVRCRVAGHRDNGTWWLVLPRHGQKPLAAPLGKADTSEGLAAINYATTAAYTAWKGTVATA